MENYNSNLTCIRKIKELVSEEDYRALFICSVMPVPIAI